MRRIYGVSPHETAFFRRPLRRALHAAGFVDVSITPFDFVHPSLPGFLVPFVAKTLTLLEKIPIVREISGSLIIMAKKR
jgi:hypothetical protein